MSDEMIKAGGGRPGKGLLVILVAIATAIVLLYINVVTSGGASSRSSQTIEGGARPPTAVANGSITPASTPAFIAGLEALGVSGEGRRSSRGRTLVSADEDSDLLDGAPSETKGTEDNAPVAGESDSLFSGQTLNAVSRPDQAREEIRQREDTRLYEARLASFSAALNSATTVFQATETPENQRPEQRLEEFGTAGGNVAGERYELAPGTVIGGLLATDINTQIQGAVIAQVLEDVYDSAGEGVLLVPLGSRLVGATERVNVGAERVEIAMTSLVTPSGETVPLDPPWLVSDSAGRAGLAGKVDRHYWQNFGNAILLGGIGAGLQLSQPHSSFYWRPAKCRPSRFFSMT